MCSLNQQQEIHTINNIYIFISTKNAKHVVVSADKVTNTKIATNIFIFIHCIPIFMLFIEFIRQQNISIHTNVNEHHVFYLCMKKLYITNINEITVCKIYDRRR